MQILIVVTTSNDRHRTCSWNTGRVTAVDKDKVARFVREVYVDAHYDGAKVTEVHIFIGGVATHHVGDDEIRQLHPQLDGAVSRAKLPHSR